MVEVIINFALVYMQCWSGLRWNLYAIIGRVNSSSIRIHWSYFAWGYMHLLARLMPPQYAFISLFASSVYAIIDRVNVLLDTPSFIFLCLGVYAIIRRVNVSLIRIHLSCLPWGYMQLLAGLMFPHYAVIGPFLPGFICNYWSVLCFSLYAYIGPVCLDLYAIIFWVYPLCAIIDLIFTWV